jgi:hypothetical protein
MKFKEVDKVRCILSTGRKEMGWKECLEFTIDHYRPADSFTSPVYFPREGHGVYEEALELVEENVKTLPKSFACKNTDDVLWKKYIAWLNKTYGKNFEGISRIWKYYGIDKNGLLDFDYKGFFGVILSLEEWDEIVNGKIKTETMKKQSITRAQLKEIHDVACSGWQKKIEEFAQRNPFGDTIEFTDKEVQEMFDAATPSQLEVIKSLFKNPFKDINLHDGNVDGLEIFKRDGDSDDALIALRIGAKNQYYLNANYNWRIEGHDLIIERK